MTDTAAAARPTIAVIGGDGIGPEVVAEAEKVLDAATRGSDVEIEKVRFSLGAARYLESGDTLTDDDLAAIAATDAILLGAVGGVPGDPRLKDANIERGLLLKLRFAFDHAINLRPSKLYPGVPTPLDQRIVAGRDVDFVVVREGTEGLYCGNGGAVRVGTPHELSTGAPLVYNPRKLTPSPTPNIGPSRTARIHPPIPLTMQRICRTL